MISTLLGSPLLAENSLIHAIGEIFKPVFTVFATILAFIYGLIPNYAIAIALLTILIMAVLTPLTVKSTKSMIAMQSMQPEIKKLQQKYKGAENREQLNQELMRLYKEQGINPAGGCIPMLLQMPFLIVLYDIIRGITNTVARGHQYTVGSTGKTLTCHAAVCAAPRYIPTDSRMAHNLVANHGAMYSFGMNLALKPFSHHSSPAAAIPFFALVAIAVVLQFIQMRQMNSRNPSAAQANPQMQTIQKIMPIFFAYIYFLIPAAVVIYMIVSTLIRIGTQDIMFRTGIVQPAGAERGIPAKATEVGTKRNGSLPRPAPAIEKGSGGARSPNGSSGGAGKDATEGAVAAEGKQQGSAAGKAAAGTTGRQQGNGATKRPPARQPGRTSGGSRSRTPPPKGGNGRRSGAGGGTGDGETDGTAASKQHPRSKAKRARKAR